MVRLKAVRARSGDRILPALYSDNYVFLMPGERRTFTTTVNEADTRGEAPAIVVENPGRLACNKAGEDTYILMITPTPFIERVLL